MGLQPDTKAGAAFPALTNGFVGSKRSRHQHAVAYNKRRLYPPVVSGALHISCLASVSTRDTKTLHKHRCCTSARRFTCSLCRTRPAAAFWSALFHLIGFHWWWLSGPNICEYLMIHQQTLNCSKLTGWLPAFELRGEREVNFPCEGREVLKFYRERK